MDSLQAELNLAEDVRALRLQAEERGWGVEGPNDLEVFVTIPSLIDRESYCIRFRCPGYPEEPFSVKPVDPETKDPSIVRAWPSCDGFRPPSDLCMPLSAEGYALHPEWRNDPRWRWDPRGNPLLRVVEELETRVNDPSKYRGRAQ
jgi:hypothetical protein